MRVRFAVNAEPQASHAALQQLASSRYRGLVPAEQLQALGINADVTTVFDLLQPDALRAADILVLHQPKYDILTADIAALAASLDALRQRGGRLVVDVSDFKLNIEHDRMLAKMIGPAPAAAYRKLLVELFARADALTLPSEGLARLMRASLKSVPPLHIIGDVIEVARGVPRFAPGGELKLLWFGFFGAHRGALAKFLREDWPRLPSAHLALVCEPLPDDELVRIVPAHAEGRVTAQPWSVPVLEQALANCDLVVLPFDFGSQLSLGRSNNRALQALYAGRAVAAHPIDSYRVLAPYVDVNVALPLAVKAVLADPAATLEKLWRGQEHVGGTHSAAAIGRAWRDMLASLQ
jgi:hypothetical protein